MKKVAMILVVVLLTILYVINDIKLKNNSKYDSKGVVVKLINKHLVECGYYLQRKNNTPFITYYLYDGVTMYSSSMSCDEFNKTSKDDIESIIVINIGDALLYAKVNKISDRLNWFDFVDNETKLLREAGLIK